MRVLVAARDLLAICYIFLGAVRTPRVSWVFATDDRFFCVSNPEVLHSLCCLVPTTHAEVTPISLLSSIAQRRRCEDCDVSSRPSPILNELWKAST
jgi:hypothetical protein